MSQIQIINAASKMSKRLNFFVEYEDSEETLEDYLSDEDDRLDMELDITYKSQFIPKPSYNKEILDLNQRLSGSGIPKEMDINRDEQETLGELLARLRESTITDVYQDTNKVRAVQKGGFVQGGASAPVMFCDAINLAMDAVKIECLLKGLELDARLYVDDGLIYLNSQRDDEINDTLEVVRRIFRAYGWKLGDKPDKSGVMKINCLNEDD